MKAALSHHPAIRFVASLILWQMILLLTLSPLAGSYNQAFRAVGSFIYGAYNQEREVAFESPDPGGSDSHLRVVIVNPALMKADGSGPVRNVDIGTWGFGVGPLSLLASLVFASPVPWSRRGRILVSVVLIHQALVFTVLGYCIWIESSEVDLVSFSPTTKHIAIQLKNALAGSMSLAIPLVAWAVITFRKEDRWWLPTGSDDLE